jgi:hypothetical protein
MSFMTMNTFAPHIWGFDPADAEMKLARAAGWSRADLVWERLMESALRDWEAGNRPGALRGFRRAHLLVRLCFARTDLRRAAGHANLFVATGNPRHQRAALAIWQGAGEQIEAMRIAPRARSSLFHLRMEARHRATYHGNMRLRIGKIAAETQETLRQLTAPTGSGHRHVSRWRGEKPNVHDDTRKLLAACLLLIDRP